VVAAGVQRRIGARARADCLLEAMNAPQPSQIT
jgi:hypothetical protein